MPAKPSPLKTVIQDSVKAAMRAQDKARLAILRQITASIKQVEVDKRQDLADDGIVAILTRMCKQRRDSLSQFERAGRDDLVAIEATELAVISEFMPIALTEDEINNAIEVAIVQLGASGAGDMGKVMGALRAQMQGRADMAVVSRLVKIALTR